MVKHARRFETVGVTADGVGLVSHAGVQLWWRSWPIERDSRRSCRGRLSQRGSGARLTIRGVLCVIWRDAR
jgi:hypothetical protein